MNLEQFMDNAPKTIDFIHKYYKTLPHRDVYPIIKPGYLRERLPAEAPEETEDWDTILKDTEEHILPGVTHWQHPNFHAYFPCGASFPSLFGDMVSDAFGTVPFSWTACPASSELEIIVMDWLCKAMDLPKHFLNSSRGGGIIHASASDSIYNCILAARTLGIQKIKTDDTTHDSVFLPQLIAYCSHECHSCVEKGVKLALLKLRILPTDENFSLRGETVQKAIDEDIANGLTPIFLCSVFGSTSSTSIDNFKEIGPICKKYGIWYHIDGAYSGFTLICPEMRKYAEGIEYADSFNANAHKNLLIHCDCACLWVKDKEAYCSSFIVDPLYLREGGTDLTYDLRHWGIPLSRRFRSLKIWYTVRTYGLKGIRKYHRKHIELAKYFEELMINDGIFDILNDVIFGLVCFRIKNSNDNLNEKLLTYLNETRKIHLIPTVLGEQFVIRFCVTAENSTKCDIANSFEMIHLYTNKVLGVTTKCLCTPKLPRLSKQEAKEQRTRMSFAVQVPQDIYNTLKEKNNLKDMVSLIPIIEDPNEENINEEKKYAEESI